MKVLILGGTRFLGPALVESLTARGHNVTLANRGLSDPDGIAGIEQLVLDRADGHAGLEGRRWDAAIDTSGMLPGIVADAAGRLAPYVGRYCFISSISVYQEASSPIDESSPTVDIPDPLPEVVTPETYGALKLLCERAVWSAFGARAFVVRPGLVVGPRDRSDRFTYWVRRIADGGTVLAPGRPDRNVQFIDVRDLAEWLVHGLENELSGTYNATGPAEALTMGALLDTCARVAGIAPHLVWLSDAQIEAAGLGAWIELPLWIPEKDDAVIRAVDFRRALAAGLRFRPLAETVGDTLGWDRSRPRDVTLNAGLDREREAAALAGV
jgi:2'-hydroxyisoflavone reductase